MVKKKTSITVDPVLWDRFNDWREASLLAQGDAVEALMAFALGMTAEDERRMRAALVAWRQSREQPVRPDVHGALDEARSQRKQTRRQA